MRSGGEPPTIRVFIDADEVCLCVFLRGAGTCTSDRTTSCTCESLATFLGNLTCTRGIVMAWMGISFVAIRVVLVDLSYDNM